MSIICVAFTLFGFLDRQKLLPACFLEFLFNAFILFRRQSVIGGISTLTVIYLHIWALFYVEMIALEGPHQYFLRIGQHE